MAADGSHCEADVIILPQIDLSTGTEHWRHGVLTLDTHLYTFSSAFIIIGARLAYILSELKKLRGWNIASFLVDTDNMKTLRHAPRQNVWSNGGCVSYFNDNNRRDSIHWAWTIFYTGSRLRSSRTNDYIPKQ